MVSRKHGVPVGLVVCGLLASILTLLNGKEAVGAALKFRTLIVSREASLLFHFALASVFALFWMVVTGVLVVVAMACHRSEGRSEGFSSRPKPMN